MNSTIVFLADEVMVCLKVASLVAMVLTLAAWLMVRLLRLREPAHLHAVWLWCVIGIAVVPPLCLLMPKMTLPLLPAQKPDTTAIATPLSTYEFEQIAVPIGAALEPDNGPQQAFWPHAGVPAVRPAAVHQQTIH